MPTLGQDVGNPQDPGQILQWMLGHAGQDVRGPLENIGVARSALQPYQTSQRNDLIRDFLRVVSAQSGGAERQAGELAAFGGRDVGKARRKARSSSEGAYAGSLNDALLKLLTQQQAGVLGAAQSASNFDLQELMGRIGAYGQAFQGATQREAYNSSPSVGEWLGGGLLSLLGNAAGGMAGGIGQGLGERWGK